MAKIKNVSGQDLEVPWLGRIVFDGQEVEVEDAEPYVCQESTWAPVDVKTKKKTEDDR